MDLHYSQTNPGCKFDDMPFYYLMDLHYSQTHVMRIAGLMSFTTLWIYTILKLLLALLIGLLVLLPYGFTLFSSLQELRQQVADVLLPYGFTLFSNAVDSYIYAWPVLLPYGFTLFSNCVCGKKTATRFYYLMDLHYSQTRQTVRTVTHSFTTLWIYTILKRTGYKPGNISSFTTLWIYTILKQLYI